MSRVRVSGFSQRENGVKAPCLVLLGCLRVEFAQGYLNATFCLAPSGLGWGIRTVMAIFYGCIPVVIQDN
eukprot:9014130-Pyramimonas_sp.AAC.1